MGATETLPMVIDAELTSAEEEELVRHEATIERGLGTFFEVGQALAAIRDDPRKLYRKHGTFEDYCRTRWDMGRRYANRIVDAARVVERLGPIGPKPTAETQVRPLTQLKPEQQIEAWARAVASVPEGEAPTEKIVRQIAREVRGEVAAPTAAPTKASTPSPKKLTARTQAHVAGTRYHTLIVNAAGVAADTLTNLPVTRLAEASANLYLWVDAGDLDHAFGVLAGWGFTCETVLTICSPDAKFGRYFHGSAEFVLVGNRAKRDGRTPMKPGVIMAERDERGHPDAFYRLVLSSTPGPYLEMFPATYREHVSVWGEETPIEAAPADEPVEGDSAGLSQKERVRRILSDGVPRTLEEIAGMTGFRADTLSTRVRELGADKIKDKGITKYRLQAG